MSERPSIRPGSEHAPRGAIPGQRLTDDIERAAIDARRRRLQTGLSEVEWVADEHGADTADAARNKPEEPPLGESKSNDEQSSQTAYARLDG